VDHQDFESLVRDIPRGKIVIAYTDEATNRPRYCVIEADHISLSAEESESSFTIIGKFVMVTNPEERPDL
jgi:hypothetical protein